MKRHTRDEIYAAVSGVGKPYAYALLVMIDEKMNALDSMFCGLGTDQQGHRPLMRYLSSVDGTQTVFTFDFSKGAIHVAGNAARHFCSDPAGPDWQFTDVLRDLTEYWRGETGCTRNLVLEFAKCKSLGDFSGGVSLLEPLMSGESGLRSRQFALHIMALVSLDEGLFHEAIGYCKELTQADPRDAYIHALAGMVYRLKGDLTEAEKELRLARDLETSDDIIGRQFVLTTELGKVLLAEIRLDDCEELCASDWNPTYLVNTQFYDLSDKVRVGSRALLLARLCRNQGKYAEAVALYRHAKRLGGNARELMLCQDLVLVDELASATREAEAAGYDVALRADNKSKWLDSGGALLKTNAAINPIAEKLPRDRIRAVLMQDWDPIRVSDEPMAQDEYDSYIPGVQRLLAADAPSVEIERHLRDIETQRIGMLSRGELQDVVRKLRDAFRGNVN